MQSWHCLRLEVPLEAAEDVAVRCFELGSCGLQSEEEGEIARLSVYFEGTLDVAALKEELVRYLQAADLVEAQDWEAGWRRFFRPVWATPQIVVHPSWIPVELERGQLAVCIDPKMAFGTGGHESTQLCLQALEKHMRSGLRCLDLGTGSGILAIVAARLGAGRVLAVDVDPTALDNARENLVSNGVEAQVEVRQGGLEVVQQEAFDLVLANIQSHVLEPMLPTLYGLLSGGGRLLLSGLLGRERETFGAAVGAVGLRVEEVLARNEWICVVAHREP